MRNREGLEKLLRDLLSERCPDLAVEKKEGKTLLYCGNYLIGSVVELDERLTAATVYADSMADPLHGEFIRTVTEHFASSVVEKNTRLSGGIEGNFYYTYVHLREPTD